MGAPRQALNPVGAGIEKTLAAIHREIEGNVVELARRMGPEVLNFLRQVMDNKWNALGLETPVPMYLRLQSAELIRKYSALPSNVDIGIKGPATIQYTGAVLALPEKALHVVSE